MKKSHFLRKGRVSIANHYYCITLVANSRRSLFNDLSLNRLLINEMRRLEEEGRVKVSYLFLCQIIFIGFFN